MKIHFCFAWHPRAAPIKKAFKSQDALGLFSEYLGRIAKFCPCDASGFKAEEHPKFGGRKLWICDRGQGSKMMSSEDLADRISKLADSGTRELEIVIGGPDGFSAGDMECLQPELCWSFGPMTLPHELAAVVAGEQIYRAFTILKNHPYHRKH